MRHDIQSSGIKFLRNLYANAGLRIGPKSGVNVRDQLRAMVKDLGLNLKEATRLLVSSES
jgi:hypothetical protein